MLRKAVCSDLFSAAQKILYNLSGEGTSQVESARSGFHSCAIRAYTVSKIFSGRAFWSHLNDSADFGCNLLYPPGINQFHELFKVVF